MPEKVIHRFAISLVTQGVNKFYTLTMPTDILGRTCFVTSRDEDPIKGFQRVLDKNRAQEIANYIDNRHGSIPSAIILSAHRYVLPSFSLYGLNALHHHSEIIYIPN